MSVERIIPWRPGCPHRARALEHVLSLHEYPVTIAEAPPGDWCKALAVMPAVERSSADVIVLADADVWTDGIEAAVKAVEDEAAWAIPHQLVRRLDENGGEAERPYVGIEGGGIVVARRETLLDVPLDPRFVGWGQEDESHGVALTTLHGRPWRGTADLTHFHHPPQPRLSRARGSRESWELRRRYMRARHDKRAMRELVAEAREALSACEAMRAESPHPLPAIPARAVPK